MRISLSKIRESLFHNRILAGNLAGVFVFKGLGMLLSLVSMPLYMDYLDNRLVLGAWFTILSVINWIVSFDLGIGNGLRNNLTIALVQKDTLWARKTISSSYGSLGVVSLLLLAIVWLLSIVVDWNAFFNVDETVVPSADFQNVVTITLSGLVISFFLRLITSVNAAIQYPVINNVVTFLTSLLLTLWLLLANPTSDCVANLRTISRAYFVIVNLPLVVVTVITFCLPKLRGCFPRLKYFNWETSRQVLSVGIIYFVLQILFMLIFVTNEWFVSKFFSPDDVVVYQIYNRLFFVLSNVFMLILMPIVAAITKAYAEGRIEWISKMKRFLYLSTALVSAAQLLLVVFLQQIVNFWLSDKAIEVDYSLALIFAFTTIISMWVYMQSAIVTGLNRLRLQLYCYIFAVIFKVSFILVATRFTDCWYVVMLATGLSLLPYCILQPLFLERILKKMKV